VVFLGGPGREVDFILVEDGAPIEAIECKLSEAPLSPALRYFQERFPSCEAWQISARGKKEGETPEGIRVAPALGYLQELV